MGKNPDPYTQRAKRSLGQNFLRDENTARKIVGCLELTPQDRVLEIGPGAGALTRHIARMETAGFFAVEKDRHWAAEVSNAYPGLQVILSDAMEFPWERVGRPGPWKCVGNLPYNVASPLMWEIFSRAVNLRRAVFMVQKEVGQRMAARPGTKAYGALTVWVQSFMAPRLAFVVSPNVFIPRPKVDSAVVVFDPVEEKKRPQAPQALSWLLKLCFQKRRKQLRSILKGYWDEEMEGAFETLGLRPQQRPEELSPESFQSLANHLKSRIVT